MPIHDRHGVMKAMLGACIPRVPGTLRVAVVVWAPGLPDDQESLLLTTNSDDGGDTAKAMKAAMRRIVNGEPVKR